MATDYGQRAKRQRTSRWEPINIRVVEQNRLLSRLQSITNAINNSTLPVDDLCRSPSPPPVYDNRGKRVNTRYDRALDKVEAQRFKLCARLKKLDPSFIPPRGMRPPKCVDKLYIPKEKEGKQNFIGLILGPRGNTQKRLEKDYECKVAIRGKGSVKDGRARGPPQPEDQESLHVVITAEGLDAKQRIDECKKRIMDIITPRQDEDNDHKQAQLRELAQLNGTFREPERDMPRPNNPRRHMQAGNGQQPGQSGDDIVDGSGVDGVSCAICSDPSHPTADCPQKTSEKELDKDYESFVKEVTGGVDNNGDMNSNDNSIHSLKKSSSLSVPPHSLSGPGSVPGAYAASLLAKAPWLQPGSLATQPTSPPPPGTMPPPQPFPYQHAHPHSHPNVPNAFQPFNVAGGPPPHLSGSHPFPPPMPPTGGVPPPPHVAPLGPGFVAPYMDAVPPPMNTQFSIPPLPPTSAPEDGNIPQPPMSIPVYAEMGPTGTLPPPPPPPPPESPPESPPPPPPPPS